MPKLKIKRTPVSNFRQIPLAEADAMYRYDDKSGVLHKHYGNRRPLIGSDGHGYRRLKWPKLGGGVLHVQQHNICFLLATRRHVREGMEIDHWNGDTADNRFKNLKEVPHDRNVLNASRNLGRYNIYRDRSGWRAGDHRDKTRAYFRHYEDALAYGKYRLRQLMLGEPVQIPPKSVRLRK